MSSGVYFNFKRLWLKEEPAKDREKAQPMMWEGSNVPEAKRPFSLFLLPSSIPKLEQWLMERQESQQAGAEGMLIRSVRVP